MKRVNSLVTDYSGATQEKQTISGPRAQLNKLLECYRKPEHS